MQLAAPISSVVAREWARSDDAPDRGGGLLHEHHAGAAADRFTARMLHARGAGRRSIRRHRAIRTRELGPRTRLRALRAQKEIMAPGWRPIILAPVREA